jgi:SAM-dependent methyltransferase
MTYSYFRNRNINPDYYAKFKLPAYYKEILPQIKESKILDIGCGFGQILLALKKIGYTSLKGIDIDDEAINYCLRKGFNVEKITDLIEFSMKSNERYDFIIMNHVLEHLEKGRIIETLVSIENNLLSTNGLLFIAVPNAQSNTGCYWAYEDFTHHTLFTAGSLYFVLKSAGFESVEFLDPDGVEGSTLVIKLLKKFFLFFYKLNKNFWNIVTNSSFHRPSPQIFTYELKAIAK